MERIDDDIARKMLPDVVERIEANKRLESADIWYQMKLINPNLPWTIYRQHYKREFLVKQFNKMFGTQIK
jgi:hypothetical protein